MAQQRGGFRGGQGGGQQRQQLAVWPDKGREGNRWVGERPTEEGFAEWWTTNVPIHDGLKAADYIGGVVLIEQTEKQRRMVEEEGGAQALVQGERLVYTPYAKVDVRVRYFWDLLLLHPDWIGVIEPVPMLQTEAQGLVNSHLPEGFYRHAIEGGDGWVTYVGHAARVTIFDRNTTRIVEWEDPRTGEPRQRYIGKTIVQAQPATKLVALLDRYGKPDPFALMKAETGAVGRALGMAGMLVIPGSGIATAEDVQEAIDPGTRSASAQPQVSAGALPDVPGGDGPQEGDGPVPGTPAADGPPSDTPSAPDTPEQQAEADDATLRAHLLQTLIALKERDPQGYAEFKTWFEGPRSEGGRELGPLTGKTVDELVQPMLRGIVRRAERALQDAPEQKPAPASTESPTDAPKSAESSAEPGSDSSASDEGEKQEAAPEEPASDAQPELA